MKNMMQLMFFQQKHNLKEKIKRSLNILAEIRGASAIEKAHEPHKAISCRQGPLK